MWVSLRNSTMASEHHRFSGWHFDETGYIVRVTFTGMPEDQSFVHVGKNVPPSDEKEPLIIESIKVHSPELFDATVPHVIRVHGHRFHYRESSNLSSHWTNLSRS